MSVTDIVLDNSTNKLCVRKTAAAVWASREVSILTALAGSKYIVSLLDVCVRSSGKVSMILPLLKPVDFRTLSPSDLQKFTVDALKVKFGLRGTVFLSHII